MTPSRLPILGLLVLLSAGVCLSSDTNFLRQIRSLTNRLRTLRKQADNAQRARFVGQLATDCGMDCKRNNGDKTEPQAERVEDQVQEAKKRFMALGAQDCGSFECVLRKRLAMEKVKRSLVDKQERLIPQNSGKGRQKRYLDILLDTNPGPYDLPSQPSSKYGNYGSNGWDYSSKYNYNPYDDYYDDNYNYYDYDYSGSGSGYNEDDSE